EKRDSKKATSEDAGASEAKKRKVVVDRVTEKKKTSEKRKDKPSKEPS
ncbi:hypothetical protein A2U01_0094852, partial [Trifolium medium]|nr:hypothetical protein [Trifolium medium]